MTPHERAALPIFGRGVPDFLCPSDDQASPSALPQLPTRLLSAGGINDLD